MTNLRERPYGVTIAIPNWNHEYLLGRSIYSALRAVETLRQHHVSAEVLVFDDYSRDGSVTLLRQLEALYSGHGLRLHIKDYNGGLSETRNLALRKARYRYILFLDADNEVLPQNLYTFYRSIRATGAAMVYGNLIAMGIDERPEKLLSSESFQDYLFAENYIDACSLVDALQVLEVGGYGYHTTGKRQEWRDDWDLNMHLATNGRLVIFVPVALGYYHILPASMIGEISPEEDIKQRQHFKRMYDQLGLRQGHLMRTRHLRYHPDLGFI